MKCMKCGRDANFCFSQNKNGIISTTYLCDECLRDSNSMQNFYPGFSNVTSPKTGIKTKFCPKCGTNLNELLKTGYLGCAECYTVFRNEIKEMLPKIQISSTHKGDMTEEVYVPIEQRLHSLKHQLDEAVKGQNFDEAKRIYDEIISLGGKI